MSDMAGAIEQSGFSVGRVVVVKLVLLQPEMVPCLARFDGEFCNLYFIGSRVDPYGFTITDKDMLVVQVKVDDLVTVIGGQLIISAVAVGR